VSKKQRRFETIHKESGWTGDGSQVIRDRETGVCYLFRNAGFAGGLTVLLNADGSPVVSPVEAS